MVTKSRLNVEVRDAETEIIESTMTDKSKERKFSVGNGDDEIIATSWGSDDNQNWEEVESVPIAPSGYVTMILGPSHWWHVKLTSKTTASGVISIVDGYLTYTEPLDNP